MSAKQALSCKCCTIWRQIAEEAQERADFSGEIVKDLRGEIFRLEAELQEASKSPRKLSARKPGGGDKVIRVDFRRGA